MDALSRCESVPLSAWYCVHARPKHEHIAAAHLRGLEEVDVFSPRLRFRRSTRQGTVWVTEAMFPGYLFTRFNWRASLGRVRSATGVSGVVHFGTHWPTIPDPVVEDLRQLVGQAEIRVISTALNPGDEVEISGGMFHGLRAVVATLLPARQRVKVLFDFLGQPSWAELPENAVIKRDSHPCLELAISEG